jgi:hypothetical protein
MKRVKQKFSLGLTGGLLILFLFARFILIPAIDWYTARSQFKKFEKNVYDCYSPLIETIDIDVEIIAPNFDFIGTWYWYFRPTSYRIEINSIPSRSNNFSILAYYEDRHTVLRRTGKIENGVMIINKPIIHRNKSFTCLIPVNYQGRYCLLPKPRYNEFIDGNIKTNQKLRV